MRSGFLAFACILLCADTVSAQPSGGSPNLTAPAPRTADGKPDLSGIWEAEGFKYNFNVAADFRPSQVPFKPWSKAVYDQRLTKDTPMAHCLPFGVPGYLNAPFKIVQTPALTVILLEPMTLFRQVSMHTQLPKNPNPTWLGYSVGEWEKDEMVVQTTGLTDRSWLDLYGHPHSEALHVTERFRRLDYGHLNVQVTLDDPDAYTQPWTITFHLDLLTKGDLLETICENNDRIVPHLVGGDLAHPTERHEIEVPPTVLRQYAGTYEVRPGTDVTITMTDVGLLAKGIAGGNESLYLFPETETTFFANVTEYTVEFVRDGQGAVTHFVTRLPNQRGQTAVRKGTNPSGKR